MAVVYHARRINGVVQCWCKWDDARMYHLTNVGVHSPDGFEMGYGGSGPADLALTILCDFMGLRRAGPETFTGENLGYAVQTAWEFHQDVKRKWIQEHRNHVEITGRQLKEMIGEDILTACNWRSALR